MNFFSYINLLRPAQWLKNLMLLFPPFLGGIILQDGVIGKGGIPIFSFCLASSSVYIFNDILDATNDASHPIKKGRPIPSGEVSRRNAAVLSVILGGSALVLSYPVSFSFFLLLIAYLAISAVYSVKLKELPIVDIFCISAGFLLRLQAGGNAFGITISEWLFLSVFLLAVFLSTGKRLSEKQTLGKEAGNHRKSLQRYPDGFLEGVMYMTGGAVLVTYTMYVIAHHVLIYTVPLCAFGLLRYIFRVKSGYGGDPTDSLLKDWPLFTVGFLWAVMVGWGIYGR
jgi:decaprenyl-phosphate phosphoribosyltransferase